MEIRNQEKAASEACRYADLEKIQLLFKVITKPPYPTASSVWVFVEKSSLFNCIWVFYLTGFFQIKHLGIYILFAKRVN